VAAGGGGGGKASDGRRTGARRPSSGCKEVRVTGTGAVGVTVVQGLSHMAGGEAGGPRLLQSTM
jgi:hypothetical protein